ncbi:MAG: ABC transporter permease [Dehalococcoidia bacterium]|nr:ABC transporter permease [Dehalococcoidia bacterium]
MHISPKRELKRSSLGRVGIVLIVLVLILAIFAPLLVRYEPSGQTASAFESPSLEHWLGTNHVGQDIWSQLAYGARTSLLVGFSVAVFSVLLSALIGASAALVGDRYDRIVMRIVDALIVIPVVIVLVLLAAYIKPGIGYIIVILSLLGWQFGARVVRAQTLVLKEEMHVAAAKSFGASNFYLIFRHIIPDLGPILLVQFVYAARRAIFMEAGLAFLGIADPSIISWGMMMHDALGFCYLDVWRWCLIPPGVALSLTVLSITFIGHAFEPVLDPRLRGEAGA